MDNGAKDKEEDANNTSPNSHQFLLQSSITLLLADPTSNRKTGAVARAKSYN